MRKHYNKVGWRSEINATPTPPGRHPTPPKPAGGALAAMPEAFEQASLAARLDAAGLVWCHVANEGHRIKATAAGLARAGVKAGVPDVLIFSSTPLAPRGAAIELKRTTGRPSDVTPHQRAWLAQLEREGWRVGWARGCAHAVELLQGWGYLLPRVGCEP